MPRGRKPLIIPPELLACAAANPAGAAALITKNLRVSYHTALNMLHRQGIATPKSKLHDENPRARRQHIFCRYQSGERARDIGRDLGISHQRVLQISLREAAERGERLRGRIHFPAPLPTPIPERLFAQYEQGEITAAEGGGEVGLSPHTFVMRARAAGYHRREQQTEIARRKWEEIYLSFVSGKTLKELAAQYHTSTGSISQSILHHRRRTGAPGKYQLNGRGGDHGR